ncbi:TPA: MarR family transcriptional regulator [Candidatus Gastranaerophilales bacterium HUM_9]|nr:MAG TPA: MarR family transcriptional regulator [Candidatus Gastranaerophilales bacterium HUM_9]HBX34426.1 MarR family transcriptional regulator [Cyanobacteria bacterium UBA11440]
MKDETTSCSYYIRNIAHLMANMQNRCLTMFGLTNQQARILMYIDKNIRKQRNIKRKDLETFLNLKGSSVTSLMHGLEKNGFIERSQSSKDARRKELILTSKARALVEQMDLVFEATDNQLQEGMTEEEKMTFRLLLGIAHNNINV